MVIGKEVFGGTGFNVLNPALTSRAFIFFSNPKAITGDGVWTDVVDPNRVIEGFTGATPSGGGGAIARESEYCPDTPEFGLWRRIYLAADFSGRHRR